MTSICVPRVLDGHAASHSDRPGSFTSSCRTHKRCFACAHGLDRLSIDIMTSQDLT